MRKISTFPSNRDYSSLSVKDLIEARDHYHKHLSHLENVVATAIGRYLIHKDDWYATHTPDTKPPADFKHPTDSRTLFNSVITNWSWPCVLVFVDKWQPPEEVAKKGYDQLVPRNLYLPDGRVIPTCVVEMKKSDRPIGNVSEPVFPPHFIGGGYPIYANVQGQQHIGSVGCLVTDGNMTYALTNRHVTGADGKREIFSVIGGQEVRIGIAHEQPIGKRPFEEVYDGLAGEQVYANIDAGLIQLDNLDRWTTQVRGLGPLGMPIDLNPDTLTLDLIDCPVRAYGAASGELFGAIAGFFYRYKSMGGFDYVADLVIAPRAAVEGGKVAQTLPGDSGTLWSLELTGDDGAKTLRPIALEWGGEVVLESGAAEAPHSFTLATAISTICRELDVDLLRGWNEGLPEYWGAVGHYTIAARACLVLQDQKLSTLMSGNVDRVSYPESSINKNTGKGLQTATFVPLADVPDYVWKPNKIGGGKSQKDNPNYRPGEQPNHFADMDKPVPSGPLNGKMLLDLVKAPTQLIDGKTLDTLGLELWKQYYTLVKDGSKGTLPFRVWEIFDEMCGYVRDRKVNEFVAAAGVLAHYVGDACQPLHISYMFNGIPPETHGGKKIGDGVHEAYEAVMLNTHIGDIRGKLQDLIATTGSWTANPDVQNGRDAAGEVLHLMQDTFDLLPPKDIVNAFANGKDLWPLFGDKTVKTLGNGVRLLAYLWERAWTLGNGASIADANLFPIEPESLAAIYRKPDFCQSYRIGDFVLTPHSANVVTTGPKLPVKATTKPKKHRAPAKAKRKPSRAR